MQHKLPDRTRILVVNDVPDDLSAMVTTLSSDEIEVMTADSGPAALELLLNHDMALAILAVRLPQMDGYELAEQIRAQKRSHRTPIIFLTTTGQEEQHSFRGYEAGAVDFLVKPIDPRILRGKVAVFVELHRQREALAVRVAEQERLARLNGLMLAALSHDIRTPLAALTLNAEMLVRREEEPVKQAGLRIKSLTAMLSRQLEHIVNLAQQPHDAPRPNLAWSDLVALVRHCIELGEEQALSLGKIELTTDGDTHCAFDAVILSDAVEQVLLQAVAHAGDNRVMVHVDGNARRAVNLRVSFTEMLEEAAMRHLFGNEVVLEGVYTPRVGPGLHIAERAVRAHGGSLIGYSRGDEGTAFELILPRGLR